MHFLECNVAEYGDWLDLENNYQLHVTLSTMTYHYNIKKCIVERVNCQEIGHLKTSCGLF